MDNKEAAITPAAAQSGESTPARRRLLAAGLAGAAASLLPWFNGTAGASTPSSDPDSTDGPIDSDGDDFNTDTTDASDITTGGTENATDPTDPSGDTSITQPATGGSTGDTTDDAAATTTTAPPKRPTADDIALLDFAQSVELTARNLYDAALEGGVFDAAIATDIAAIREAHEGYGTAIAGLIGRSAQNKPIDALYEQLLDSFSGEPNAVATAMAELEDVAVATHIDIIGQLQGVDGSALIASIVVIESRNSTLLKSLSGISDLDGWLTSDATALTPSTSGE